MINKVLLAWSLLFLSMGLSVVAIGNDDVYGELELQSIYENEPSAGQQFFEGLNFSNAYESMLYINRELLNRKDLSQYIPFETQIGIGYRYHIVLFTLMKQNYLIKKLEYEAASQKFKENKIDETSFKLKQDDYQKAKKDFEKHYNSVKLGE
jgi:hypothetical protein